MPGTPLTPWASASQARAVNLQLCQEASPGLVVPYYLLFPPATGAQFPGAQWGLLTPQKLHPIPGGMCDGRPPHGT